MANFNRYQSLLLKKLCLNLLDNKKENLEYVYRKVLENVVTYDDAEFQTSISPWEEHQICDEIVRVLKTIHSNPTEIIERFLALTRQLKNIDDNSNYLEILLFLLKLNHSVSSESQHSQIQGNDINANMSLSGCLAATDTFTSINSNSQHWASITASNDAVNTSANAGESASQIKKLSDNAAFESPLSRKFITKHLYTDTPILEPTATSSRKGSSPRNNVKSILRSDDSVFSELGTNESGKSGKPDTLAINSIHVDRYNVKDDYDIPECEIMRELLFCMQGIEGKIIRYKSVEEGFYLNPCIRINQPYMVLHLMELGYLHNRIKQYTSALCTDVGTVAQGLINAIRRELTQYYQALANLDSQLNPTPEIVDTPLSNEECSKLRLPSLSQLIVWSRQHFLLLQTLCDVLRTVQNKRGGQIISDLVFFAYSGNANIRKIVLRLLSAAIQPFYKQIFYWVVNGEIIDIHDEFFIKMEGNLENVEYKNAWDRQFVLRPSMIPKYMSLEEANQILEAGRCMNFLHNICHERPPLTQAQNSLLVLEKNKWNDPHTLIEPGSQVTELINKACREVSKTVLHTLNENFKMQIHLEALRKYMLLGQGDFIHYLLEIIEPDLNKCVGTLHTYNLMRSLEDAMYKSNAQYDDPAVLDKLCIKMLATSDRESASEVFCLQYRLEGPLNTIFKKSCVGYNRMFTFMWRVKRANYLVLKMWRGLKLLHKEINYFLPDTKQIFVKANTLVMEMVNFISHFQYYIASEVVEVSWRKFQNEITKMESLEKVLQAHTLFLESMQSSCMLNVTSGTSKATMAWHIRTLLDYVQELVPIVEMFQTLCESEAERRKLRQKTAAKYGVSLQSEQENNVAASQFHGDMNKVRTKFKVLSNQHQDKLKSLLVLFSENQEEHDLILLSHRIDFNEYYKQNDSRLSNSLKLYKQY